MILSHLLKEGPHEIKKNSENIRIHYGYINATFYTYFWSGIPILIPKKPPKSLHDFSEAFLLALFANFVA